MEEDLNGQPVLGILNLINFKEEIPHSVFIYINQDDGDEYVFHKYNDKISFLQFKVVIVYRYNRAFPPRGEDNIYCKYPSG